MLRIGLFAAVLALASGALAQLNDRERQGLSDALFLANLEQGDLARPRSSSGSDWFKNLVNDPVAGVAQLDEFRNGASQKSLAQMLGLVRTTVYGDPPSSAGGTGTAVAVPDMVPSPLRSSVKRLIEEVHLASDRIRQATEKLSLAERRTLIEALPRMAAPSGVKFDFVRQPMPDRATVQALLSKVDLGLIRFAGHRLAQAVVEEVPKLQSVARTVSPFTKLKAAVDGVVLEIGGMGPDLHDETDAVLCIDLGGNDVYTGRYGAGVGYSGVLIDLDGDDVYSGPDLSFGAGVLGVGIACDMGGDDRVKGKSIGFGSGIAGVGAWLKDGGDDDYRSASLAQGFGFHGMGILVDTSGEDHYRLGSLGQGSAKAGGSGLLYDKSGSDSYRSGGLIRHPYLSGFSMSMSQGFAEGPNSLGVLMETGGDDVYYGDARAQACGTREGVAALLDSAGRDTYGAGHDAQSSANLSGAAYLIDTDGDDTYTARQGNSHGFAANHGLAVLLDRSGSDLYAAQDSRPGSASTNGSALFIDAQGDDRYLGPPGIGSLARGGGSIGLFVDLAGFDRYAEGLSNLQAKSDSNWGVAWDGEVSVPNQTGATPPTPGSKPLPDDAGMEAIYARAVADDRAAIDELTAIGEPALRWLLARKLEAADETAVALMAWLAIQVGGLSEDLCVAAIDLTKEATARAAIQICQESGHRRAGPRIVEALGIPSLARTAIRAAGALQIVEAVDKLQALSTEDGFKKPALVALSQIGDPKSEALMQSSFESGDADLRLAASLYFASKPQSGMALGSRLIGSGVERTARSAVELLGRIGSPEALTLVGKALADPRRGVQIQAMSTLDTRVPREFWPQIVELRKSADPLVKAVASRLDLGR